MKLNKLLQQCKEDIISNGGSGFISCVCLTCGVRNDHKHKDGLCKNGHDDWLEYRDVLYKNEYMKRAMKTFRLEEGDLTILFANMEINQFGIIKSK